MLVIDGSQGEGGGQILRTSLSMAMVTGTEFRIENIRAGRAKPGMMRQHLACVKAAQRLSDAKVSGAKVGSTAMTFKPGSIRAGDYEFAVGTAGSTSLIFQTVLPALAAVKGESQLSFHGGTHNMMAPSYDFIRLAYVPLLRRMGLEIEMNLQRHGFFPQGGGEWSVRVKSSGRLASLDLQQAGELVKREMVVTNSGVPEHVALREMREVATRCGWSEDEMRAQYVHSLGSGNHVSLRLHFENCAEVIEEVGRIGVSAERVARKIVKALRRFTASDAVVGEYLADQLLLPMIIGQGGTFRTFELSRHFRTNRDVIQRFTHKRIRLEEVHKGLWDVRC